MLRARDVTISVMTKGKHVRLFLVDGTPGGLMTAEIMNWTGHLVKANRSQVPALGQRPEGAKTGVYILVGKSSEPLGRPLAYIGQSDNIARRLRSHETEKDFWQQVVLITSKDANLTTAHVRFLEAHFIREATRLGRFELVNGNTPTGGAELPEADHSDMLHFAEQVETLLPLLGIELLRGRDHDDDAAPGAVPAATESPTGSPVFHLKHHVFGIDARAQLVDSEFTVLKGSRVAAESAPAVGTHSPATRRQVESPAKAIQALIDEGSIQPVGGGAGITQRDIVFNTPSAAAATVQGRAAVNGRIAWLTEDGLTFGDWEDSRDSGQASQFTV